MGGNGSGNWYRRGKKSTVEESLVVEIKDFRDSTGTITWSWAGGNKSAVGYFITLDGGTPNYTLLYR